MTETDNITIISDLTDNNTISSFELDSKIDELVIKLTENLNKLTNDNLKEKCKSIGLPALTRSKKPELIGSLVDEYKKMALILKDKTRNDLKIILRNIGAKGLTSIKKDILIYQIMELCVNEMKFRLPSNDSNLEVTSEINSLEEPKLIQESVQELSLIEQLEKQKMEIEQKMKDEMEKIRIMEEERKRIEEEEAKKKEEQDREEQKKKEKEEAKKKKQSIPKNVRAIVWNHYIGEDIIKHKCLCCKKVTITNTSFEVGHVLSEKNGGTHEINNLRPICFACNHSMGTENMIDFVVKFGLYIG